ncbi:MAG TPA: SgcJ/EcaC family oxidoreductase [Acidimicrobiia bacterium]|nr:SgcJ/EcaC family oxidoreductase [Acidimicrobiia bacterium]
MGAKSLDEFGEMFAAAYRARDPHTVADFYEDDAIFAMPDAGYPIAIGRAAIIERMAEIFRATQHIEWSSAEPAMVLETADYVIVHQTSRSRVTMPDGNQFDTDARATYVMHRGTDGNWRIVIDHGSSV